MRSRLASCMPFITHSMAQAMGSDARDQGEHRADGPMLWSGTARRTALPWTLMRVPKIEGVRSCKHALLFRWLLLLRPALAAWRRPRHTPWPWPSAWRRRPQQTLAAMVKPTVAAPAASCRGAQSPVAAPACGAPRPHYPGISGAEARSRGWDDVICHAPTAPTGPVLLLVDEPGDAVPSGGPARGTLALGSLGMHARPDPICGGHWEIGVRLGFAGGRWDTSRRQQPSGTVKARGPEVGPAQGPRSPYAASMPCGSDWDFASVASSMPSPPSGPFAVNAVKIKYRAHGSNASHACGPPQRVSSLPVARAEHRE
jgi:hypothetical protein